MVLSMEVPQDIIDEIIDILQDDNETLKKCSSVSNSFRLRSRRLLFATITIDSPRVVSSLRSLLYWRPELARLVHTLRISSLDRDTFSRLPLVLSRLRHVRHLELGKHGSYFRFDRILTDFNLMIMEVLKLPQIHTLSLHSILNFPAAFLRIPPHLTHLNMMYVECVRSPRLESTIDIPNQPLQSVHVYDMLAIPHWPLPGSCGFQRLVMGKSGQRAQPILDAGSRSLEEIVWRDYTFYDYGSVDFSELQNLRQLSFEVLVARDMEAAQMKPLWESITQFLQQGTISQTLEVFNIAIKPHLTLGYLERDVEYLGEVGPWSLLADSSRFPRLREVTIHCDSEFYDAPGKNEAFGAAVRGQFPLLETRGVLWAKLCGGFDWRTFL